MFRPTFIVQLNEDNIQILLDALVALNLKFLEQHPSTPPIYQSGVVYQREKPHSELWLTIPAILRAGSGDCEDLSCWRAAELVKNGIKARAFATRMPTVSGFHRLWHIRVSTPRGIEDPSKLLGMKGSSR